jgi:hypothetical protein
MGASAQGIKLARGMGHGSVYNCPMQVWRERLPRWFAPLARHCPLSPNAISLLGLLINTAAAALRAGELKTLDAREAS